MDGGRGGPYRTASRPIPELRPANVAFPRSVAESALGEAVHPDILGRPVLPKTWPIHGVFGVVTLGPFVGFVLVLVLGYFDAAAALGVMSIVLGVVFGWAWWMVTRVIRASARINRGDLDGAEKLLGSGRSAKLGTGLFLGLCAQLRGDQAGAAELYRASMTWLEGQHGQALLPHAQAVAREAMALTSLGRLDEAAQRLQQMPNEGAYNAALRLVAYAYLRMVSGAGPDATTEDIASLLEREFTPVKGSWGGLALAAHAHSQLGNEVAATRLIDEERHRAKFEQLETLLPELWRWMHTREPG